MRPNGDSLRIIAAQCYIYAILIFSFLLYWLFDFQAESLIYPACLFFVALTIWSFWSWQIVTKSLFDPYILFFISAVLFNGGQAFLEVFHLNEHGILEGSFSSETLLKTLVLVILGLASFHLGALLSAATAKAISPKQNSEKKASLPTTRDNCHIVGWGLLSIAFLPAVLISKDAILIVLQSGYAALYQQDKITSFNATPQILADFLIPGTLFLLAGSKKRHNGKVVSVITIVIYSLSRLFLGWRGYAIMPLIAFAWLWHSLIRPLPKIFLLSAASLTMFIIFPLVAATRNVAGEERLLSISFLLNSFTSIGNPLIAAISEMGGTMQTIPYTLELVPSVRGFDMGAGYLYALLTLIPNFFWEIHPAIARGTASHWLIWEVDPIIASLGGGIGFSFIAEAYFNFGWFGAPIALGVIGFFFGKLTLWAIRSGEPARMAMIGSFLSFFLFYVRDEACNQVRPLVWYALIPYLGVWTLNWLRSKGLSR
jgi:oligosaccharide repeat unit polymerase